MSRRGLICTQYLTLNHKATLALYPRIRPLTLTLTLNRTLTLNLTPTQPQPKPPTQPLADSAQERLHVPGVRQPRALKSDVDLAAVHVGLLRSVAAPPYQPRFSTLHRKPPTTSPSLPVSHTRRSISACPPILPPLSHPSLLNLSTYSHRSLQLSFSSSSQHTLSPPSFPFEATLLLGLHLHPSIPPTPPHSSPSQLRKHPFLLNPRLPRRPGDGGVRVPPTKPKRMAHASTLNPRQRAGGSGVS